MVRNASAIGTPIFCIISVSCAVMLPGGAISNDPSVGLRAEALGAGTLNVSCRLAKIFYNCWWIT